MRTAHRTLSWILAAAAALTASACLCGIPYRPPCQKAEDLVRSECRGTDTGDWQCAGAWLEDACWNCARVHLGGDGTCEQLADACVRECCPDWSGCEAPVDAGPAPDAGRVEDAGPIIDSCGAVGQMGGVCRSGVVCATGLTCFVELSSIRGGAPLTLGTFGVQTATEDPANPGEHIPSGVESDVPIRFAPGGQCSRACDPSVRDDGCGMCATCSTILGGSPAWTEVGLTVRSFDLTGTISDSHPGICRRNCQYDPATNGDCPEGYTCDPGANVCVEACVSDSQCNVAWGLSRSEGDVVYELEGAPFRCEASTGRCEWTAPSDAGLNTPCAIDADCPHPGGVCLLGDRCATLACSDATGTSAGPVACDGVCLGFGGNNGSICLEPCSSPDECFPGQACSALSSALPTGETGICFAACADDTECRSSERCHEVRADDPDRAADDALSVCDPICDPDPADGTPVPDAISCAPGELCERSGAEVYGYCARQGQLCFADADCNVAQACEVLRDDLYGRCVDGCETDGDCTGGERCRVQPDSSRGVCRADGEPCAPSHTNEMGQPLQPLRGDAQCPAGQTCDSADPDLVGTCA